jgi:hypothetical protein
MRKMTLPLTCNEKDEKDEYNSNLLGYVQIISTKALNSVCSSSHPQLYHDTYANQLEIFILHYLLKFVQ